MDPECMGVDMLLLLLLAAVAGLSPLIRQFITACGQGEERPGSRLRSEQTPCLGVATRQRQRPFLFKTGQRRTVPYEGLHSGCVACRTAARAV